MESEDEYDVQHHPGVFRSEIPFPRPGDMDVGGTDVGGIQTIVVDDGFEDELYYLTRNMSNLSNGGYAVVNLQVFANTPTIERAITAESDFIPFTGRDPDMLRRMNDATGRKHVGLHRNVSNLCMAIAKGGDQLEPFYTEIVILAAESIHSKWKPDVRNDAADFYTWLISHLEIATDVSCYFDRPDQLITMGNSTFRVAAKRPEQYFNERYEEAVKSRQEISSLPYHLKQHQRAHLESGHDSPLTRLLEIQYIDLFQCADDQCGPEYRRVQYSFQIMLEFPPEVITNSAVTLSEMMMHTLITDQSETVKCPRGCKFFKDGLSQTSLMHRTRRAISQLGEVFAVEIQRRPLSPDSRYPQHPTDEGTGLIKTRVTQYMKFDMSFLREQTYWARSGEQKCLSDHDSLQEEYEIHAIAAFNPRLAHYVVFIKIEGYWVYFDSLRPLPVLRHPMMDWPQDCLETMLWYQRTDSSDMEDVSTSTDHETQPSQSFTPAKFAAGAHSTTTDDVDTTQPYEKRLVLAEEVASLVEVSDLRKEVKTNKIESDLVAVELQSKLDSELTMLRPELVKCQKMIRVLELKDQKHQREISSLKDEHHNLNLESTRLAKECDSLADRLKSVESQLQSVVAGSSSFSQPLTSSNLVAPPTQPLTKKAPASDQTRYHYPAAATTGAKLPANMSAPITPRVGPPLGSRAISPAAKSGLLAPSQVQTPQISNTPALASATPNPQRATSLTRTRIFSPKAPTVGRAPNLLTGQRSLNRARPSSSSLHRQFGRRETEVSEEDDTQAD